MRTCKIIIDKQDPCHVCANWKTCGAKHGCCIGWELDAKAANRKGTVKV